MNPGEALAAQYFRRAAKIEKLNKKVQSLRRKNKKTLSKNPWIGHLLGTARKSKVV